MSTLFTIDLETGNLTQWDETTTDGGDLSASAGAALHGSYGMAVLINENNNKYVVKNITKSTTFRHRFYFDPNTVTIAEADWFTIGILQQNGGIYGNIVAFRLYWYAATGFKLRIGICRDDNVEFDYWTCNITDAPHYIEFNLTRATTNVSANGTCQWWVDGVDKGTTTGIDNYNEMIDYDWYTLWGATNISATGTSGTIYFDDFTANNDGTLIGPIATGVPKQMDYYRRLRT